MTVAEVRIKPVLARMGVALAILGGSMGITAAFSEAASATSNSVMVQTQPLRWGPSTGYGYTWTASRGDTVVMVCWTDTRWTDGSNRWFEVRFNMSWNNYAEGFVPANSVGSQSRVGHC